MPGRGVPLVLTMVFQWTLTSNQGQQMPHTAGPSTRRMVSIGFNWFYNWFYIVTWFQLVSSFIIDFSWCWCSLHLICIWSVQIAAFPVLVAKSPFLPASPLMKHRTVSRKMPFLTAPRGKSWVETDPKRHRIPHDQRPSTAATTWSELPLRPSRGSTRRELSNEVAWLHLAALALAGWSSCQWHCLDFWWLLKILNLMQHDDKTQRRTGFLLQFAFPVCHYRLESSRFVHLSIS